MDYEELLKKAMNRIPKHKTNDSRFEIPQPIIVGAGGQTLLKNFAEIAKILRREPKHFAKFLLKELAAPGNIEGNKLIIQKKVTIGQMGDKINKYVKEYVYCPECRKPDTKLIKEERRIKMKCEACGAKRYV